MRVMTVFGFIFEMSSRDGDTTSLLLGGLVDRRVVDEVGESLGGLVLGDGSGQSGLIKRKSAQIDADAAAEAITDLSVINVTNGSNVCVRLVALVGGHRPNGRGTGDIGPGGLAGARFLCEKCGGRQAGDSSHQRCEGSSPGSHGFLEIAGGGWGGESKRRSSLGRKKDFDEGLRRVRGPNGLAAGSRPVILRRSDWTDRRATSLESRSPTLSLGAVTATFGAGRTPKTLMLIRSASCSPQEEHHHHITR